MNSLYTRQIVPKATPGLAGELDSARAMQRAADAKVVQLEQELEAAHDATAIPEMTEHEWCLAFQRAERNIAQHKANLDYLDQRWLNDEFCSDDLDQPKAQEVMALMKCQERLDYALAKANLYKLKLQYECAQIGGDYEDESAALLLQIEQCLQTLVLPEELKHNVVRVFGISCD